MRQIVIPLKKSLRLLYEAKQECDDITVHIKVSTEKVPDLQTSYDTLTINRDLHYSVHYFFYVGFTQNQREQTEKQIREEFAELQKFLLKEEAARIAVLAEEAETKKQTMKKKTDLITRDILTFSQAVMAIENEIAGDDSLFLQVICCVWNFN